MLAANGLMKLKSLIQNGPRLEIAEVEIEFIPGIPQIHFLGLPDRIIKESFYRIKAALKSSGYKFPLTQQMIVNIKPSHLRKSSRGVELAVALGILLKSKQLHAEDIDLNWILYGELGLDGRVYEPSDLKTNFLKPKIENILTGWSKDNSSVYYRIVELKNLEIIYPSETKADYFQRPTEELEKKFSKLEAEFLFLAATTGLHGLLAGDAGAGKTTIAKALLALMSVPGENEPGQWKNNWRPMVMPHQSITAGAFLGGGANLYQGEIERAQNGLLILDEMLQFNPEILEALRGPMVGERLRLARGALEREFECQFQAVATTNLCPCGKWTPVKENLSCRYSRTRCTKTLERLSGPFVDRFGLMLFTETKNQRTIPGMDILRRVERLRKNRSQNLAQENISASTTTDAAEQALITFYSDSSTRRINYLKQVSYVYSLERAAESSSVPKVQVSDFDRAESWVIKPFKLLERGMS